MTEKKHPWYAWLILALASAFVGIIHVIVWLVPFKRRRK